MTNRWPALAVMLTTLWLGIATAVAQGPPAPDEAAPPRPDAAKFNLLDQLPGVFPGEDVGPKLFLSARFELEDGTRQGRLHVTAEPAPGWHVYSMTQPKGGPLPSRIEMVPSPKYRLTGPFTPDHAPEIKPSDVFFKDPATRKQPLDVEEHHHAVTWSAPLDLAAQVDPQALTIRLEYDGQVCKESCVSITEKLEAKFSGFFTLAKATGEFTAESGNVTWRAHVEPQVAAPGSTVKLVFTGTPVEPYHLYAYESQNNKKGFSPTLIALRPLPAGWKASTATTSSAVVTKPAPGPGFSELTYHRGAVTWTVNIDIPATAELGQNELKGLLGFQTCTDEGCDFPSAAAFRVTLPVAAQATPGQTLVAFEAATYNEAAALAKETAPQLALAQVVEEFSLSALLTAIGFGLLGGLILNVMPCVLPVIPLKLLSFVEQAGQSRAKLMSYNLVYAAGTIAVFLVLAIVGVIFGLGWGEHFALTSFQIIVTLFMFAMTLSLIGLWEIPLPGAIGSGEAVSSEKGSLTSAFWKGFMTTIYATPCSGPFLGIALGATLDFPVYAKFIVFTAAGLGFASPYIVFGLLMAQWPSVTRFIPKPGVWMEHLKQGIGFMLLLVVLYYFCLIDSGYRVATLFAAIGVAFGCWIIGKVPPYAETGSKLKAWSSAVASIALACWLAFTYMGPTTGHNAILPWQPYSAEALAQAQADGKTVLIEFTADWCPTCQVNYRFAIDTHKVHEVVQQNDVVVLLADWSDRNEAIKHKITELKSESIPLLAVYPGSGDEPIVLRDLIVESQVVSALEKAGPSRSDGESSAAATAAMASSGSR